MNNGQNHCPGHECRYDLSPPCADIILSNIQEIPAQKMAIQMTMNKTNVIFDDRPILFVNQVPTSNLEMDVMVMDELDHVRGGVCYQALLYRIIDEHGAFIPAVWEHGDKHLSGPGQGSLVNANDCLSKIHRLLSKSLQKLRSYLKNSHQNSWTHLAASMGLACSELKTSQGANRWSSFTVRIQCLQLSSLKPWFNP